MADIGEIIGAIEQAWDHTIEPMGYGVTRSALDTENLALVAEFGNVRDWRTLTDEFIDQAPDGFGTALAFFSDAIQYFIAGYMIADIKGSLRRAEPLFALVHGFDAAAYGARIDPDPTSIHRWEALNREKTAAIVAYLESKENDEFELGLARAALDGFWIPRLRTMQ